ncbi:MAG: LacI family DNA-binding transcriptional regulator [Limnochordia bacterium]|jgi:DNA-binding LacI/PurR family transcriptional regulator|nr:LacI family DNA-binding transcriptional regulator [Limnochordia bacterium]MDI9465595.1 LacI family DNA-binding transcriptional regulator [Bacillota bacterium]NLO95374.1 LacI family transcriptional regulator [Bacillota bacterium]HOB39528.1 LacI family DNA-binding transcriptional regulator [Limnochordia bacterium]HOK30566.1 LacI family DNA-binding transcriptional regulator [Limnochordia bacterium]
MKGQNRTKGSITMAELAKICGYSKATVSRALSDDPRVKPETKALILEMARRYNYRPHTVASNLARRRTKTIGLMFPSAPRTIADPFFLEYLHGVSETLFEQGFSLLIPQVRQQRVTETIEELVAHRRVDGIILTEPRLEDERIVLLQESNVPFVFLGSTVKEDVSWVDGDNRGGICQGVRALGALGHRRIAVILGEEGLVSTEKRFLGYQDGLAALGLKLDRDLVWPGDFTRQGGYRAVVNHLDQIKAGDVTAIMACNDLMAIGAIQALNEAGVKVPEQVSVMGFDGIEVGKYLSPPLTTVQQPVYSLGREVARVLLGLIAEEHGTVHLTLPVTIVNETNTIGPASPRGAA